jgi:hypothetical protein
MAKRKMEPKIPRTGVILCLVNGESAQLIVAHKKEGACVFDIPLFVSVTPNMEITDYNGQKLDFIDL